MLKRVVIACLTVPLLVLGLLAPPAAGASAASRTREQHPQLRALLDELVTNGAPGVLALVDDGDGRMWRAASGSARLDPVRQMRPGDRFRIGSVTKTFVATVILQLAGEGRLRLDDPVARWLPGLVPGGDAITIRQLLTHTSGLFNYSEDEDFVRSLVADPQRTYRPRQLVAVATQHPPLFPPGQGWYYSNTNYVLAGLVIRAVTGHGVQEELQRRVFAPAGLRDTSFPYATPRIVGPHAHGYLLPGNDLIATDEPLDVTPINPSWAWAAGAVVSTTDDVARFYRALLGGRLLGPAQLRAMQELVQVAPGFAYGLGLFTVETSCGTVWGHNGSVPGYYTVALNSRRGGRNLVLAMNATPDERLAPLLDRVTGAAVCAMLGAPEDAAAPVPTSPVSPRFARGRTLS